MGEFIDITGQKFNEWTAIEYVGKGKWKFRCSCNREKILEGRSVRLGRTKSCGHGYNEEVDLTNKISGDFKAIKKFNDKYWKCICTTCGKEMNISRKRFREEDIKCSHRNSDGTVRIKQTRYKDIKGQVFGDYKAIDYIENSWKCRCINCGKEKVIQTYSLQNNKNECVCRTGIVNIGDTFGEWTVLERIDESYLKCKCSCNKIGIIRKTDLLHGKTKSCGHDKNEFIDLTNQLLGNWKVLEYKGEGMWLCECQCENKTIQTVHTYSLRSGNSTSCGCMKRSKIIETKISKYGEISTDKYNNPREIWQIETINDKDKLKDFIINLGSVTITEIANKLSVNYSTLLQRLKKFEIANLDNIEYGESQKEKDLYDYIVSKYKGKIIKRDRHLLGNLELDIYIPELKIAFEFNGGYWHSDLFKNREYHQEKTIACARKGVRLIHIFEYEWDDTNKREKILRLIDSIFNTNKGIIYARKTDIEQIDLKTKQIFINEYHLQEDTNSLINLGCYYNDTLVGVMTFDKPRFNSKYDYEIIRFVWKNDIVVIGGAKKLLSYFINKYKPKSIITYVDISKFTGNTYSKAGFKLDGFTEPNYIWWDSNGNKVLTRYQTQKNRLVELGIGTEGQTEDEIMKETGYLKIYDSGNLRLVYTNE